MNLPTTLLSILANITLLTHAAFVLFVIVGQIVILIGWLRNWFWTRLLVFRGLHLAAIGYVVLEAWFGIVCPLTVLENHLRQLAGEATYSSSFISDWVHYFLFYTAPTWVFTLIYSLFGSLVLLTFIFYP
ncbi:MAG TPA: DUF2784 domain-containing protein, partial [Gammaproteobacteria bacterium]|nr:DUF2784 domain-containing protein [Gammaproteobacteria bacterium]